MDTLAASNATQGLSQASSTSNESVASSASSQIEGFWQNIEQFLESATQNKLIAGILVGIAIIAVTIFVSHCLTKLIKRLMNRNGSKLPATTIFINIERIIIWGIGISLVLSVCFNINVTAIVAALGIGGIAISLGMQDTISNFISGLQLNMMGTIKPGDHIRVDGLEGVVRDITWRYTTVVGIANECYVLPNNVVTSTALEILPPWRKVKVQIDLPFETLAYYENQGMGIDLLATAIEEAVTDRLSLPEPAGMHLPLDGKVEVIMRSAGEYAYLAFIVVWIAGDTEFDRQEVEDNIARATVPFTCKGRGV